MPVPIFAGRKIACSVNFVFFKSKELFRPKEAQREKEVVAWLVRVRAVFPF